MAKSKIAKIVSAGLLALIMLTANFVHSVQTASAQASFGGTVEICTVNSQALNVRSGPGTGYSTVATALKKGQRVVVFSSIGGWVRHGDGGWSARSLMTCFNYNRNAVIQSVLPAGYWLHTTAVDFDGNRVPAYDVISGPDGSATQFFLPREGGQRIGNVVSFTQPRGTYSFKGVAAELFQDRQHNGTLVSEASHQNDKTYAVTQETGWLRVVNDASPVNGFSVTPTGGIAPVNSPYGTGPNSFTPDEGSGQFWQYSFDCETDEELPAYRGIKMPNGDIWVGPWLPAEAVRANQCFYTNLNLIEGRFELMGIKCQIFLDSERDKEATELAAEYGNNLPFEVDTFKNNLAIDGESWGRAYCLADPHNGFSIRWVGPLN